MSELIIYFQYFVWGLLKSMICSRSINTEGDYGDVWERHENGAYCEHLLKVFYA